MTPQLGDTAYGDGQRLVCGAPGEYAGSVEVLDFRRMHACKFTKMIVAINNF